MADASNKRITKKRGRPKGAVGKVPAMVVVPVRLPASLLLKLDEWVALARRSRSEAIRLWIENGLLQKPRRGWYKPKSDIL